MSGSSSGGDSVVTMFLNENDISVTKFLQSSSSSSGGDSVVTMFLDDNDISVTKFLGSTQ